MSSARAFWEWFDYHKGNYESMEKPGKEALMDDLLSKLHDFHPDLYFQVGIHKKGQFELVITADGRIEHFFKVEDLVREAPKFENWQITAFKQPMGYDFTTQYKGIEFNPAFLWFLPLSNSNFPGDLGLRIGISIYQDSKKEDYYFGISMLLDACLGEKSAALHIDYPEVSALSKDPESSGWVELVSLSDYLNWLNKKAL